MQNINIYYTVIKQIDTVVKLFCTLVNKSVLIHLEELFAQTTHHIAWFLAQHINTILLTDISV